MAETEERSRTFNLCLPYKPPKRTAILCAVMSVHWRTVWVRQRSGLWWEHVNANWTDRDWQLNFRMRKSTFQQLCDLLRPHLQRQPTKFRQPVPVEQRVAICVWRLATNAEFQTLSHLFGIGQSTAATVANHVASVIVDKLLPLYIRRPSEDEFRRITRGFRDRWGFPQCAGAIAGTHIRILAPTESSTDDYNSKGFHSVVLQGVVDHRLRFWDVNVGRPGKADRTEVFGSSPLFERGQSGALLPQTTEAVGSARVPLTLLGGAAYPLLPWLMKPYPENQRATPAQLAFNGHLSRTRSAAGRAFGRLKGRWRCLLKRYDCNVSNLSNVVSACCVLHNFCEDNCEDYEDTGVQEDDEDEGDEGDERRDCTGFSLTDTSHATRDALCAYFASQ